METESEISQIWWTAWKEKLKQTDIPTLGYYRAMINFSEKTRKRMSTIIEEELKTRPKGSDQGTSTAAKP